MNKCARLDLGRAIPLGFGVETMKAEIAENHATITVHCSNCGGQNVKRDAHAEWNPELQLWELSAVYDDWDCDDCGHSVSVYDHPVGDLSDIKASA